MLKIGIGYSSYSQLLAVSWPKLVWIGRFGLLWSVIWFGSISVKLSWVSVLLLEIGTGYLRIPGSLHYPDKPVAGLPLLSDHKYQIARMAPRHNFSHRWLGLTQYTGGTPQGPRCKILSLKLSSDSTQYQQKKKKKIKMATPWNISNSALLWLDLRSKLRSNWKTILLETTIAMFKALQMLL